VSPHAQLVSIMYSRAYAYCANLSRAKVQLEIPLQAAQLLIITECFSYQATVSTMRRLLFARKSYIAVSIYIVFVVNRLL